MDKPFVFLGIDDNADNLVVLQALLSESYPGSEFLKACTGEEGLKLARARSPHVILLDIVMPGMDGYEVCTTIKNDESIRHIPVVFITAARTDKDNRIKALRAGADGFLSKPVDAAELKAQIVAMLRIREAEELKHNEKSRLEAQVNQRTMELETELQERRKIEEELRTSMEKLAQSKLAALNLMEDLKTQIHEREAAEAEIRNNEIRLKSIVRVLQHKEADTQHFLDLAL